MNSKRSPVPGMTLGWTLRSLAALLALLARPAGATLSVYASDDPGGEPPGGVVELDTVAADPLELWIDKGDTPSPTACDASYGVGDAICGYHVRIEVQGSGYISAFVPDSGAVIYHPSTFSSDTRQLQATCVDVNPSSTAAPVHIGTLTVDATGGSDATTVLVLGEHAVAANLALENIPSATIATTPVPEPGELLLLASGIAGLAALYRLRRGSLSAA